MGLRRENLFESDLDMTVFQNARILVDFKSDKTIMPTSRFIPYHQIINKHSEVEITQSIWRSCYETSDRKIEDRLPEEEENFLFSAVPRPAVIQSQYSSVLLSASCSGIKRPRRESNRSSPFSAYVKSSWDCTSNPLCVLITSCLIIRLTSLLTMNFLICRELPPLIIHTCRCTKNCTQRKLRMQKLFLKFIFLESVLSVNFV
jgi:hypothetical protein